MDRAEIAIPYKFITLLQMCGVKLTLLLKISEASLVFWVAVGGELSMMSRSLFSEDIMNNVITKAQRWVMCWNVIMQLYRQKIIEIVCNKIYKHEKSTNCWRVLESSGSCPQWEYLCTSKCGRIRWKWLLRRQAQSINF